MIKIEICLNSDDLTTLKKNVTTAYQSGADRIELCSAMEHDGLTPSFEAIKITRQAFEDRKGLLVMIRPRSGDFCYSSNEISIMAEQISQAKEAGADGVAFGCLTKDHHLDLSALSTLIKQANSLDLEITFHRAFDALVDTNDALTQLIELGIQRVLTSGLKWGDTGTAVDGIEQLKQTLKDAKGQVEIVIGGRVSPDNALVIKQALSIYSINFSLHSYSGVLIDSIVQESLIKDLLVSPC